MFIYIIADLIFDKFWIYALAYVLSVFRKKDDNSKSDDLIS